MLGVGTGREGFSHWGFPSPSKLKPKTKLTIFMKNLKIKVPVSWKMEALMEVEAKTLAEAAEIARSDFAKEGLGLPEGTFIKGSYEVDDEAMDVFQSDAVNEQAFKQEDSLNETV